MFSPSESASLPLLPPSSDNEKLASTEYSKSEIFKVEKIFLLFFLDKSQLQC